MEYRSCGNSDLKLSVLGLGCWAFGGGEYWGEQNQQDVNEVVREAVNYGINYFDSAEAYNNGQSEVSLGQAIKTLPRNKLVIGTKISPSNTYPDILVKHCEDSLKRLATDYIDIYMVHWPVHSTSIKHFTKDQSVIDNPPSIEEALETMKKLQQQGKIKYIGVSNFAKPRLDCLQQYCDDIVVNELPYSLLTRAIEWEALPYCADNNIGIIGYMVLLQGLLADIYPTLDDVPQWQRRTRHFNADGCELTRHGEAGAEKETNQALAGIRKIMTQCKMTMPEIAIKWAVANKNIACSLVGARNAKELKANVKAAEEPLPQEIVDSLNKVTQPLLNKLGPSFDYYESEKNNRTV